LFGFRDSSEHDLLGFWRENNAVSLIMLIGDIAAGRLRNGLAAIGKNLLAEILKLLVMLLEIIPRDALKLSWL
jgi:hypothetical protein